MLSRITLGLAGATLAVLALAGCSAPATTDVPPSDTSAQPDSGGGTATGAADLATGDTSLGTVVVDGTGMTVYVFDNDTAGATSSACSGGCADNWPAVHAASDSPQVDGVTGEVGTITGTDGELQVTLNGLPLYTFAGDKAAGDVNGQGVSDIWWAVSADGSKISAAGAPGGTNGY
jgi:predicted lipoprotein with Yx(FWY)xxD motif